MRCAAAALLAAAARADVTGVPCDPARFERRTAYDLPAYTVVDLDTLPSPLNINATEAGRENFCCLYCVRDSRCQSWTLRDGRTCSVHAAAPGSRRTTSGAVSGTPLPRVPDIPSDPQGSLQCLPAYARTGQYKVSMKVVGAKSGSDQCTPCWKPEPDGAEYLVFTPKGSSSKLPAYVWMPAEGQSPTKYTGALEHIASHGFVVVAPFVDYSKCHSNLCAATGAIYRNNSYAPSQRFLCQAGQCVPDSGRGGLPGADCVKACGPLVPKDPVPNTTCTVEQVVRGEAAVKYALNNAESLGIEASLPIGIGGASATAPQALKVASHISDSEAAHVGAVVVQHPSIQPSHVASLDAAFQKFGDRAKAGKKIPAVLGLSGYLCARLGACAAILQNKPCRTAAAQDPPDEAVLANCGDCTSDAGRPVAWHDFVLRYAGVVKGKVAAASIAGPWHHWVPQSANENPTRQGCGTGELLPETPVVIAWLTYALKNDASALKALQGCTRQAVSSNVDDWLLGRLDEDRLRDTPAGALIEQAIKRSGTPITLSECHIANGRVATHIEANFTGTPDPTPTPPPEKPTPRPRPTPPPRPATSYVQVLCDTKAACISDSNVCGQTTYDMGQCMQTTDGGSAVSVSCDTSGLVEKKFTSSDCSGYSTQKVHPVGKCVMSSVSGKYIKRKCVS